MHAHRNICCFLSEIRGGGEVLALLPPVSVLSSETAPEDTRTPNLGGPGQLIGWRSGAPHAESICVSSPCLRMRCYVRPPDANAMATCCAIKIYVFRAEWWCCRYPGGVDMHGMVKVAGQVMCQWPKFSHWCETFLAYIHQGGHACMHACMQQHCHCQHLSFSGASRTHVTLKEHVSGRPKPHWDVCTCAVPEFAPTGTNRKSRVS